MTGVPALGGARVLAITPGVQPGQGHELLARVEAVVGAGVGAVVVREPHLDWREALAVIEGVEALVPGGLVVHTRTLLSKERREARGWPLHLPQGEGWASDRPDAAEQLRWTFRRVAAPMGLSCHTRAELQVAAAARLDWAWLSPVEDPISKAPGARPALGLAVFSELARGVGVPVVGLGGLTPDTAGDWLAAGAAAVAGIGAFFPRGARPGDCAAASRAVVDAVAQCTDLEPSRGGPSNAG